MLPAPLQINAGPCVGVSGSLLTIDSETDAAVVFIPVTDSFSDLAAYLMEKRNKSLCERKQL